MDYINTTDGRLTTYLSLVQNNHIEDFDDNDFAFLTEIINKKDNLENSTISLLNKMQKDVDKLIEKLDPINEADSKRKPVLEKISEIFKKSHTITPPLLSNLSLTTHSPLVESQMNKVKNVLSTEKQMEINKDVTEAKNNLQEIENILLSLRTMSPERSQPR